MLKLRVCGWSTRPYSRSGGVGTVSIKKPVILLHWSRMSQVASSAFAESRLDGRVWGSVLASTSPFLGTPYESDAKGIGLLLAVDLDPQRTCYLGIGAPKSP